MECLLQSFHLNFSGQFQIGAITFEISLSVKYPELVPHDVELAEVIAYQLEVDANQVKYYISWFVLFDYFCLGEKGILWIRFFNCSNSYILGFFYWASIIARISHFTMSFKILVFDILYFTITWFCGTTSML